MIGLTLEEKKQRIMDFRPIDDVFFEVLAKNKAVDEEILRTIMEDDKLVVEDVIVQSDERNLYGRSVRLDALCTLGNNTKCNIEVQRSPNDEHLKRARFNASSITVQESQPGEKFSEIIDLYIVYISEFDFLKGNKTIYHIDKVIRETGVTIDDGLHEIFVNTVVDDGTDIADLMACFVKKEFSNPKFPEFSAEVKRLKNTEGGAESMCEVMEKYTAAVREESIAQGRAEGRAEGEAKGRAEGRAEGEIDGAKKAKETIVFNMVNSGFSHQDIMKVTGLSESELRELLCS